MTSTPPIAFSVTCRIKQLPNSYKYHTIKCVRARVCAHARVYVRVYVHACVCVCF